LIHFTSSNGTSQQESRIHTKRYVSIDDKSWIHGVGLVCMHGGIRGKHCRLGVELR